MEDKLSRRLREAGDILEGINEGQDASISGRNHQILDALPYLHLALEQIDDSQDAQEYLAFMEKLLTCVMLSDRFTQTARSYVWCDIEYNAWPNYSDEMRERMVGLIARLLPNLNDVEDFNKALDILEKEAIEDNNASIIPLYIAVKDKFERLIPWRLHYLTTQPVRESLKRSAKEALHGLIKDTNPQVSKWAIEYANKLNI